MRALALGLLALAACGGDVHFVPVRLADPLRCARFEGQALRSVGVEVVREKGDGLEQIPGLDACFPLPNQSRNVGDLLSPFEEGGVILEGVPAETRTILRFIGYVTPSCLRDSERVCGVTCPPVREDELPEGGVSANFICQPLIGRNEAFTGCLNLEQLNEEARANICSPPRE